MIMCHDLFFQFALRPLYLIFLPIKFFATPVANAIYDIITYDREARAEKEIKMRKIRKAKEKMRRKAQNQYESNSNKDLGINDIGQNSVSGMIGNIL